MALEATAYAGEFGLTATIALLDMPTARTCFTRIAWVYKDHRHACPLRFVGEKRPQLSKTPIVLLCPLAFANRHPVTNVRQVFEHKRGLRVFRQRSSVAER